MANICAIVLRLSPEFRKQLRHRGVAEAVVEAAKGGRAPTVPELVALGQAEEFAALFSERLGYLVRLREAGVLRAAGPFEGLEEGMYLCTADDEDAARRVLEEDPLYQAGLIEREYSIRRWSVAI